MADVYGLVRQAARARLRASEEYAEAVDLGVARRWLTREGDELAERLFDEAWKRTPRWPDPDAFPNKQLSTEGDH